MKWTDIEIKTTLAEWAKYIFVLLLMCSPVIAWAFIKF